MEQILLISAFSAFLTLWIVSVVFYTPACFRLRSLIDSIDRDGEPNVIRIKSSLEYSFKTLENWLISLPASDKYLKHHLVVRAAQRMYACRIIMSISIVILIISILILLVQG
jgi:hypothetical protein